MKHFLKKFAYISCFMFGVIFTLLAIPVGYISYQIMFGIPIQTIYSKNHTAILRQMFGIFDYNLMIEVDGTKVYHSGDMIGQPSQLRTTLVWDKTGRVVAFERMGQIIFAYDAQEKREVKNDDLKNYYLSPMMENYRTENQITCGED